MKSPSSGPRDIEIEHRMTIAEQSSSGHGKQIDVHETRITLLEKLMRAVIYALTVLATGKTGDMAELLTTILKARL